MTLCLVTSRARRAEAVSIGIGLLGTFYRWNGKDPTSGLDCSGFVTWCLSMVGAVPKIIAESPTLSSPLKKGAYFRGMYNSTRLWLELPAVEKPEAADIACYGTGKGEKPCSHVMLCVGDGRVIGASGGDSTTISRPVAIQQGAAVKVYASHLYRKNFIGFRKAPFPEDP